MWRWFDGGPRTAVLCGTACFVALLCGYVIFVHHFFYGLWSGPFLMSTTFGIPSAAVEAGILPTYEHPVAGWDGQCYYHQSNDPFLLGDGKRYTDNAPYRYQRNLIPILAYVSSRAVGFAITPALWYQVIQFLFAAAGFGTLFWLCREFGLSGWNAFVWILSGGMIWSMFRGLPDAPADALFIISLAAIHRRNLTTYVIAATMLALCREAYALYAATVCILTVFNVIVWSNGRGRVLNAALTTLPGVFIVAWGFYVSQQLDSPFLGGSRVPWGVLLDWPMAACYKSVVKGIRDQNKIEVMYRIVTGMTLITVAVYAARMWRSSVLFAASVPYIILITMAGSTIWEDANGYLKAAGSVIVIGLLLLKYTESDLLRVVLVAQLLIGIHCGYEKNYRRLAPVAPVALNAEQIAEPAKFAVYEAADGMIEDTRCRVACEPVASRALGLWHSSLLPGRELLLYSIRVENTSDTVWKYSRPGMDCVCLGVQLKDSGGAIVYEGRRYLRTAVAPGEHAEFLASVPKPKLPGEYTLKCGMIQEGRFWFSATSPAASVEQPIALHSPTESSTSHRSQPGRAAASSSETKVR